MKKGLVLALLIVLSACEGDDKEVIGTWQLDEPVREAVSGNSGADSYDRWADRSEEELWNADEALAEKYRELDFDDALAEQFANEDAHYESIVTD